MRSAIECLPRGATDYIAQPFHAEVLAARLDACLDQACSGQRTRRLEEELATEKRRSEHLLGTLLPGELVKELRETRRVLPRRCQAVAVLVCDVVGFPELSDTLDPHESISRLQRLVLAFEEIAERHRLEKVKTDGTAFVAAAGLFESSPTAALDAVHGGVEMAAAARGLEAEWPVRVGVHRGALVAGVLGHRKVQFDLWGTAMRIAARVTSSGSPGAVHVSGSVWRDVAEHCGGQRLADAQLAEGGAVAIYRVDRLVPPSA